MHGLVFLVYDKSLKLSLLPIIPWCNTIRFGNFKFVIFKVVIPDTQAPCVSNSYILLSTGILALCCSNVFQVRNICNFVCDRAVVSHKLVGNWISNKLLSAKV